MFSEQRSAFINNFKSKSSIAKTTINDKQWKDITTHYAMVTSTPMCRKEKQHKIETLPSDLLSPIRTASSDDYNCSKKSSVLNDDHIFNVRPIIDDAQLAKAEFNDEHSANYNSMTSTPMSKKEKHKQMAWSPTSLQPNYKPLKRKRHSAEKDNSFGASLLLEDCIPRAKRKSNRRRHHSKFVTGQQRERKSSRHKIGPIKYWEQRLNYVNKSGILTIDPRNPVKGKISEQAVNQKLAKIESGVHPIHELISVPREDNSTGSHKTSSPLRRAKRILKNNSVMKAGFKKRTSKAVEKVETTEGLLSTLPSLKVEIEDIASKMSHLNDIVSSEGFLRIKPGKQRISTCTSKTFYTVLRGCVKIFVDDEEQYDSQVSIKQGQTIEIFNQGKKEDCIIYFAERG